MSTASRQKKIIDLVDTINRKRQEMDYIEMLEQDNIDLVQQNHIVLETLQKVIAEIHTEQATMKANIDVNTDDISMLTANHDAVRMATHSNRTQVNDTIYKVVDIVNQLKKESHNKQHTAQLDEYEMDLLNIVNHNVI